MTFFTKIRPVAAIATILLATQNTRVHAYDLGGFALHGSLSATASASDHLNFLGDTRTGFDLNVAEAILNGSRRFENGIEVTAQFYGYRLAGYNEATIDFASVGYSFIPEFGIRAGRVKVPFGLYGDTQDVDFVRPFAFLPLDIYPKTLRPLTASVDGATLYGHLDAKKAGSFDYQGFGGSHTDVDTGSPYIRHQTDDVYYNSTGLRAHGIWGLALTYNPPVDGLKVGYSMVSYSNLVFNNTIKQASDVLLATGDSRVLPGMFPPGAWNYALAGQTFDMRADVGFDMYSVEYTKGAFVFSAEYQREKITVKGEPPAPLPPVGYTTVADGYYGMVTWQALKKVQVGAYYAESFSNINDRNGKNFLAVPSHRAWLKDACVAVSYSVTDWWLVKAEVHGLDGTKPISGYENAGKPVDQWGSRWNYYVLKTTLTF